MSKSAIDLGQVLAENMRLRAERAEYDKCRADIARLTAERDECRARLSALSAAANQPALLDDRLEALETRMAGSLAELHSTLSARLDALEGAFEVSIRPCGHDQDGGVCPVPHPVALLHGGCTDDGCPYAPTRKTP